MHSPPHPLWLFEVGQTNVTPTGSPQETQRATTTGFQVRSMTDTQQSEGLYMGSEMKRSRGLDPPVCCCCCQCLSDTTVNTLAALSSCFLFSPFKNFFFFFDQKSVGLTLRALRGGNIKQVGRRAGVVVGCRHAPTDREALFWMSLSSSFFFFFFFLSTPVTGFGSPGRAVSRARKLRWRRFFNATVIGSPPLLFLSLRLCQVSNRQDVGSPTPRWTLHTQTNF